MTRGTIVRTSRGRSFFVPREDFKRVQRELASEGEFIKSSVSGDFSQRQLEGKSTIPILEKRAEQRKIQTKSYVTPVQAGTNKKFPYYYKGKGYSSEADLKSAIKEATIENIAEKKNIPQPSFKVGGKEVDFKTYKERKRKEINELAGTWQQQKVMSAPPEIISVLSGYKEDKKEKGVLSKSKDLLLQFSQLRPSSVIPKTAFLAEKRYITPFLARTVLSTEEIKKMRSRERTPAGRLYYSFEIGAREYLQHPLSEVGVDVIFGIGTESAFRFAGKTITKIPRVTKFLGSSKGVLVRKIGQVGLISTFVGTEAKEIASAPDPAARFGQTPLRLTAFLGGAKIASDIFSSSTIRKTRFGDPFAEVSVEESLQRQFSGKQAETIRTLTKTQMSKRVTGDQPTPRDLGMKDLPSFLTTREKKGVLRLIKEEKPTIFGSLSTQLTFPESRPAKDIDVAIASEESFLEKAGQLVIGGRERATRGGGALGTSLGKVFDVKSLEKLEEYPFVERVVETPSGQRITRQPEQLGRKISGFLDPERRAKKGRKDIEDAMEIASLLLEEPKAKGRRVRKTRKKESKLLDSIMEAKEKNIFEELPKEVLETKELEQSFLNSVIKEDSFFGRKGLSKIPSLFSSKSSPIYPSTIIFSSMPSQISKPSKSKSEIVSEQPSEISKITPSKSNIKSFETTILKTSEVPSAFSVLKPAKKTTSFFERDSSTNRYKTLKATFFPRIEGENLRIDFDIDKRGRKRAFYPSLIAIAKGFKTIDTSFLTRTFTGLETRPIIVKKKRKRKKK